MVIKTRLALSQSYRLPTDVPTRWNSTYIMIYTALKMTRPLKHLIQFREELRHDALSYQECDLLESVSQMLKVSK